MLDENGNVCVWMKGLFFRVVEGGFGLVEFV